MAAMKFSLRIFTHQMGYDYYDLTEAEMGSQCCIYGGQMYFFNSIPKEEIDLIDVGFPTLYDVVNYETTTWWDWPEEQLQALQKNEKISKMPQDQLDAMFSGGNDRFM